MPVCLCVTCLERNRSYESTSFVETQATLLLKTYPVEFVQYPLYSFMHMPTILIKVRFAFSFNILSNFFSGF